MFEGFSPETVDFLWGIRMNNSKEWFEPHKADYKKYLYEPMKAMGQELFEPFLERPGSMLKVSRIYRDARMHHPTPYKERLWLCIRQEGEQWDSLPCLFFEMAPEGANYGFGYWQPGAARMERFRKQWSAEPDRILKLLQNTERASGVPVTAQLRYKRPKPCENPDLQELFSWRGVITCAVHEDVSPELFGPELLCRVQKMFAALLPLYDYFYHCMD